MASQSTTIYTPFADGRTVRDIVEHSPALVRETWCRDLLRHILDSLERQYATGAPHRPVSPDTIVMLDNNEALLLPAAEEVGPAGAATLAADLHALALVVHYAITAELPPQGPLGPRLYDEYSGTLTKGLDRCLGPNQRLRPKTIAEMRSLLGIGTDGGDAAVPTMSPTLPAATVDAAGERPAPDASAAQPEARGPSDGLSPAQLASLEGTAAPMDTPAVPADEGAAPSEDAAAPPPFAAEPTSPAVQDAPPVPAPAPDFGLPLPAAVTQEVHAVPPAPAAPEPKTVERASHEAVPSAPRAETGPRLRTPSADEAVAGAQAEPAFNRARRADAAPPAGAASLPRTPATAAAATGATPQSSATAPPAGPAAVPGFVKAAQQREEQAARRASGRLQRWGLIAGAVIALLAAGSALVHFLQENDARDMAALSLPPAERAANGLDTGETVVAPSADAAPPAAGSVPADGAGAAGDASPAGVAPDVAASSAAPVPPGVDSVPGKASEAVVNGTTYKLLIKPWGTVYVDGVDRGVSPPVKRLTLGRGQHTIRIVNPNFPEHVLNVDAGTQESATIEHDFAAKAE
ncbi:MAG: hypothetical protein V7631_4279 [Massilia sp.]|jgi:hypothetical protein